MNLTYSIKQIIILRKNLSICTVSLLLAIAGLKAEVTDIIVQTSGEAIIGYVTEMDRDSLYYKAENSVSPQSLPLHSVYYAYNDFGKILYYSRSLMDRLNYIERYSGYVISATGDTVNYKQIFFDGRMTNPVVYLTINDTSQAIKIPLLEITSIRMSAERFDVSVKRGCLSGTGLLLGLTTVKTFKYFKDDLSGGLFSPDAIPALINALTSSANDFLPESEILGTAATGSNYRLATTILPLFTVGWIGYDWYFDKRTIYINPLTTAQPYPRDMFLFSFKEWSNQQYRKIWTPVSRVVLEQVYQLRLKIWKG